MTEVSKQPAPTMKWLKAEGEPPSEAVLVFTTAGRWESAWFCPEYKRWQLERTDPCDDPIFLDPEQITHWMIIDDPAEAAADSTEIREAAQRVLNACGDSDKLRTAMAALRGVLDREMK